MPDIVRLSSRQSDFRQRLDTLLAWDSVSDEGVFNTVKDILKTVRREGDQAVVEYTNRFDRMSTSSLAELEISHERLSEARRNIPAAQLEAIELAAERIRVYAEKQRLASWSYTEADGTLLGQQVAPLDRVGMYVPGGKAAYPSSVLMNAIPAKVAGVPELIMVVPTPDGEINDMVMAAADVADVDRVFAIGGAQAIAALAYGTQTIPQVDKIVGPGNIYVATAKRMVFGTVGIDMVAGPSEILVICDGQTDPAWIAADLFSQAEHDEDAQAILVSPDEAFLDAVAAAMDTLLEDIPRAEIIRASLSLRGALIHVQDMDEAVELANYIAPEHLELSVDNPQALAPRIRHAGAIFMGRYTCEALGDYCAGPNHVLPTSRTARFSSPLGVYDFQKRTTLVHASAQGADTLGRTAAILARGEGLIAHARSAEYRLMQDDARDDA
ncbi:histidinol dehydrogenase [Thiorhodospira sibirica]|uniref:histidinol dehydrogenase n=1 Tax=Thiorhodospira sibirica TaxID=154347 RepID=UPI00022C22D4|nr:histidinol dehydrogenase [Thiorhodospira sibirica]